ncbi:MAG: DJ-1/PfpI family protein [Pseudomonadota bacterium]
MNIAFPLYDDVTQLDFTGPVQVLSRLPGASVHLVSESLQPIRTDSGFAVVPTTTFADCPPANVICVPGGPGIANACGDNALLSFVAQQAKTATWITSVCTGFFVLGKLGLTNNRNATTHWGYTHLIEKFGAKYVKGRFVIDGNVITGGGVTAGIDFGLYLAAQIAGEDTAKLIQLALEYDPDPPFAGGHPDRAASDAIESLRPRYARVAENLLGTL